MVYRYFVIHISLFVTLLLIVARAFGISNFISIYCFIFNLWFIDIYSEVFCLAFVAVNYTVMFHLHCFHINRTINSYNVSFHRIHSSSPPTKAVVDFYFPNYYIYYRIFGRDCLFFWPSVFRSLFFSGSPAWFHEFIKKYFWKIFEKIYWQAGTDVI